MLLMKDEACPICYEVRSLAIQCGLGIAYPMVLGPLSALMVNINKIFKMFGLEGKQK